MRLARGKPAQEQGPARVRCDTADTGKILLSRLELCSAREGRVYADRRSLFWWSRKTSKEALLFLWLASTLYPDAFADIDMEAETRAFYRSFYRIGLSDEEIGEVLTPAG